MGRTHERCSSGTRSGCADLFASGTEREGAGVTYHFAPEALSQFYFVRLVVRLRLNGASSTQVYELHRRGRFLANEWRRVEALTDSFFSSVKLGTWPSMPLTPWAP
jgi:hypothetical protein